MRRFPELRPNLWDGLVVLAVAVLIGLSGFAVFRTGGGDDLTAVISVDGEEQERIRLSALTAPVEKTISAGGYTLYLVVSPEGAEVRESDCPTQDCVHTGTITRPGQSIVCLPARVTVQLVGGESSGGLDAVIG